MSQDNLSLFSEENSDSQVLPDTTLSERVIKWLADLYDVTDWRIVVLDTGIDREYDGISIICYLKALALPYLVNLPPSERALGRIILDRSNLQQLCGFSVGYPLKNKFISAEKSKPSIGARTFWHFRKKYKKIYSELITKTLVALILSGKYPNANLPFVHEIKESEFGNTGNLIEWSIDAYRSKVLISLPWTKEDLSTENDIERFEEWKTHWMEKFRHCKDMHEYRLLKNKYDEEYKGYARRTKKGFTDEITFPVDVSISLASKEKKYFRLTNPDWLNKHFKFTQISPSTSEDAKASFQKYVYDKACNILVIRGELGNREILLSRRKVEGVGEGSFAAPGGKQKEGESLERCAIRELEEETGLVMEKSRPVSLYYTLQASGRQIMSVGVLAESLGGELMTKEPSKHVGWEWYKLDALPEPIFEFTRIAINQYQENKYPNLTWDDVEEKPDAQLPLFDDLYG